MDYLLNKQMLAYIFFLFLVGLVFLTASALLTYFLSFLASLTVTLIREFLMDISNFHSCTNFSSFLFGLMGFVVRILISLAIGSITLLFIVASSTYFYFHAAFLIKYNFLSNIDYTRFWVDIKIKYNCRYSQCDFDNGVMDVFHYVIFTLIENYFCMIHNRFYIILWSITLPHSDEEDLNTILK